MGQIFRKVLLAICALSCLVLGLTFLWTGFASSNKFQVLREEGMVSEAKIMGKQKRAGQLFQGANFFGIHNTHYMLSIEFDRHAKTRFRDFESGQALSSKGHTQAYPHTLEVDRDVYLSAAEDDAILVVFSPDIAGYDDDMFQTVAKVKKETGFAVLILWYIAAVGWFFACWLCVSPLRTHNKI